jgi:hypothetical protein
MLHRHFLSSVIVRPCTANQDVAGFLSCDTVRPCKTLPTCHRNSGKHPTWHCTASQPRGPHSKSSLPQDPQALERRQVKLYRLYWRRVRHETDLLTRPLCWHSSSVYQGDEHFSPLVANIICLIRLFLARNIPNTGTAHPSTVSGLVSATACEQFLYDGVSFVAPHVCV